MQDAIKAAINVQSELDDSRLQWDIEAYISTSIQELKTEEIIRWVQIIEGGEVHRWQEAMAAGEDEFRKFTLNMLNSKVAAYQQLGLEIPYTTYGPGLMAPDILKMTAVMQYSKTLLHIRNLLQKELATHLSAEREQVVAYASRRDANTPKTTLRDYLIHNDKKGLILKIKEAVKGGRGKSIAVVVDALRELCYLNISDGQYSKFYNAIRDEFTQDIGSDQSINKYLARAGSTANSQEINQMKARLVV